MLALKSSLLTNKYAVTSMVIIGHVLAIFCSHCRPIPHPPFSACLPETRVGLDQSDTPSPPPNGLFGWTRQVSLGNMPQYFRPDSSGLFFLAVQGFAAMIEAPIIGPGLPSPSISCSSTAQPVAFLLAISLSGISIFCAVPSHMPTVSMARTLLA